VLTLLPPRLILMLRRGALALDAPSLRTAHRTERADNERIGDALARIRPPGTAHVGVVAALRRADRVRVANRVEKLLERRARAQRILWRRQARGNARWNGLTPPLAAHSTTAASLGLLMLRQVFWGLLMLRPHRRGASRAVLLLLKGWQRDVMVLAQRGVESHAHLGA
jgi:hypothetical protein